MKPGAILLLIILTLGGMTAIVAGIWWYSSHTEALPSAVTTPEKTPPDDAAPTAEQIIAVRRKVGPDGLLPRYLELFKLGMRRYPRDLRELYEKPAHLAGHEHWDGPYVARAETLIDPWGSPYRFQTEGPHNTPGYDLWSVGYDGKSGTPDDIGNW